MASVARLRPMKKYIYIHTGSIYEYINRWKINNNNKNKGILF